MSRSEPGKTWRPLPSPEKRVETERKRRSAKEAGWVLA
jgi:hypothetical protein